MSAIPRSSKFPINPNGHGGERRSAQLQELVVRAGLTTYDINNSAPVSLVDQYINGLLFLAKYKLSIRPSRWSIRLCGQQFKIYHDNLAQCKSSKILLWEDTDNYAVPYVAKDANFKILALPHNLESLVDGQRNPFTYQVRPDGFTNEIKHLSKADATFCISREEQWLLKLYGIDEDYLPYYPPEAILLNLLELRRQRREALQYRFLVLGTAFNPPTQLGMIEQLQWLSTIDKSLDFTVDIVGYGTEALGNYCHDPRFMLHGTVDADKLNHLLLNAKAILVHQKSGVGALTRIPEMLIAGVPIIANANACRSSFSYSGVHCYDNRDELTAQIRQTFDPPGILDRPIDAEKRFINCIQRLINNTQSTYTEYEVRLQNL